MDSNKMQQFHIDMDSVQTAAKIFSGYHAALIDYIYIECNPDAACAVAKQLPHLYRKLAHAVFMAADSFKDLD